MPSSSGAPGRGTAAAFDDAVVLLAEAELIHLFLEQKRRVADVFHLHPAHHLSDDGFDVLVVDVDALQAVNLLHRVDEIGLRKLLAEDGQNVMRVQRTVNQRLAGQQAFAFLYLNVYAARDGIFLLRLAVFAFDVDFCAYPC